MRFHKILFQTDAHVALQNVKKDYVIFSYFRNFIAKSDRKPKMKNGIVKSWVFYFILGCKVPEAANISSLNSKEIIKSAPTGSSSAAPSKNLNLPPPVPPRTNHSHHVTTTYITQDEVTVSTSSSNFNTTNAVPGATAGVGAAAGASADQVQISVMSNDPTKNTEIMTLRDMLLTDNSVESS